MTTCAALTRLHCRTCRSDTLHASSSCVHCGSTLQPVHARTLLADVDIEREARSRKRGNARAAALMGLAPPTGAKPCAECGTAPRQSGPYCKPCRSAYNARYQTVHPRKVRA